MKHESFVLLNLPGPYCRAGSRWAHKREPLPKGIQYNPFPFDLAYATSYLMEKGFPVDVKDCVALEWSEKELLSFLKKKGPGTAVIETSTPSYSHDLKIMKRIKALGWKTVAVGAHATVEAERCIKDGYNFVVEGEYIVSLQRVLSSKKRIIEGKLVKCLDSLPYPERKLLPIESYSDPFCRGKNIAVLSSKGCPMRCSFCLNETYYGFPNLRLRDPKKVAKEVESVLHEFNPDEIYFDDDNIGASDAHLKALCREMKELNTSWSCMSEAGIKRETLKLMADSGCRALKFGVESADEKVLEKIPKRTNLREVKETVRHCKKFGIKTHATYMIGLPYDSRETIEKTIKFALELDTDTLQFSIATPYPGTRFYDECKKNGWLASSDWEKFNALENSPVSYPWLSGKEIERLHKKAWIQWNKKLLFRPGTVFHHLSGIYRRGGFSAFCKACTFETKRLVKNWRE